MCQHAKASSKNITLPDLDVDPFLTTPKTAEAVKMRLPSEKRVPP